MARGTTSGSRISGLHAIGAVGILVLGLTTGGCPTNSGQDPNDGSSSNNDVSFSADIAPLFQSHCASCHQPGGFAALSGVSLDLRAGTAYSGLFEESATATGRQIVVAGDPDASFLFEKVTESSPSVGERMPLFGAALSDSQIAQLRAWILAGAPNN